MKQFGNVHITWTGAGYILTGAYEDRYFVVDTYMGYFATLDHDYYEDDWDENPLEDFDISILEGPEKAQAMVDLFKYLERVRIEDGQYVRFDNDCFTKPFAETLKADMEHVNRFRAFNF